MYKFLVLFFTAELFTLSVEDYAERYKVNDPGESCDEEDLEVKPNATCDNGVRVLSHSVHRVFTAKSNPLMVTLN